MLLILKYFVPLRKKYDMQRLVLDNKTDIINQIRGYLEMSAEAKFLHRLQVILSFADTGNGSCNGIGELFGNSPRSVSSWVKRVNQTDDIESLRSKPKSGRPTRLSKTQKAEIRTIIQDYPEKRSMPGRRWKGNNLSSHISLHYDITLKIRSCQKLLKELSCGAGVSPRDRKANKSALKQSQ